MKYISDDVYGPWDSPHIFCKYQTEFSDFHFSCFNKEMDSIEKALNDDNNKIPDKNHISVHLRNLILIMAKLKDVKISSLKRIIKISMQKE